MEKNATKLIYLDNAATTKLHPQVLEAMMPCLTEVYGNASSVHSFGREAAAYVEKARQQVADAIGAKKNEIYFTAGGTESDNWAIKGAAIAHQKKGKHIVTSAIEHHAVFHTCQGLEKQGFEVTYVSPGSDGIVCAKDIEAAIRPDTILVTVMAANNEIGTIQPVAEIGAICRERKIYFHTDAVQAVGHIPIDVVKMNVDLLSLSAHKFYGPKGVGALYVRSGVRISNLMEGGAQERGKRAGTENPAGVVGLGAAIEIAVRDMEKNSARESALRDRLFDKIIEKIPHVRVNGSRQEGKRLPGNVNVSIRFIEGEGMLLLLDMQGIAASSGSACTSGSLDPSHVLLAIGLDHETAHGSLRLTLSHENTQEDIDHTVDILSKSIERLRAMSPLFKQSEGGVQNV
jgi:cysteine desulfurase